MKEEIKKYLRLNGKTQEYLCHILNLSQPSVSAKMNGRQPWHDFELDILKERNVIS